MLKKGWLGTGLGLLLLIATAQAGSYSQNFNTIPEGSSDLGDGSTIVSTVSSATNVYYNGSSWRALRMTEDEVGETLANYVIPDLNPGSAISEFTATFSLLITYGGGGWGDPADGFSFNLGTINTEYLPSGGEYGMYSGEGNMLSVCWTTFMDNSMRVWVNDGEILYENNNPPIIEDSIDAPFQSVTIHWDSNGLDVVYGANTICEDLDVSGFTPTAGDLFAFAARTGAASENVFLDNVYITTGPIPEPLTISMLAAAGGVTLLRRKR